jgi:nanoRNase/pAp phosphatase (c-di-AMP/oligoRNAs hydrolase)
VGGTKKQDVKISLRSTKDFFENTGIHLGRDIAIPIGELLKGVGGGHAMAAGINGTGKVDDAIKKCMDRLKSMIQ